ncbi:MAG: hypothetical protein OXI43_16110 [Candidatus Poribacteria bacterium]|nr:hypothetical protein [Candidatus Poribacteria bacterium]
MKKFNKLLRLMSVAADLTLEVIVLISGVWVTLIPAGLFIFFHIRAWRDTDATLPLFERFNETIRATFWENIAVLALVIVLRNITYWVIKYCKEKDSE